VDSSDPQGGQPVTTVYDKHLYTLELRADKDSLGTYVEQRRVYVFAIDSDGNGTPLYPPITQGDVMNIYPRPDQTANGNKEVLIIGSETRPARIRIQPPFGTDTYFLLTTQPQDSINVSSLQWKGVRGATRGAGSPLDRLLSSVGTRGAASEVPTDWSLERIAIQSVPNP